MNAKTEIANLALAHLGIGTQISDLDTDDSSECKILRTLFDYWMSTVLCGYSWKFATTYANIEPIICFPTQEYKFAYRYPADCHFLVRFWNGEKLDDRTNMIPFDFMNDSEGRLILTDWGPSTALTSAVSNMTQPIPSPFPPTTNFTITSGDIVPMIQYIQNYQSIQFFPAEFIWAFSLMLAAWAAPSMPNIGMVDLREKNLALGMAAMQQAMAHDRMEAKPPFQMVGELTKSRTGYRFAYQKNGLAMEPSNYTP
jgi:hypothetical protein